MTTTFVPDKIIENMLNELGQSWARDRVTGTISLNFSEGTLVSLDLREHRRVMHNRDAMSRERPTVRAVTR